MSMTKSVNVRLKDSQIEAIKAQADRLGLGESEIARRAIAEGLKTFSTAKLPGSQDEND